MALRFLLYIADLYRAMVDMKRLYSSTVQQVPAPSFIVFYNGSKCRKDKRWNHDEIEMKLSDCFLGAGDEGKTTNSPNLELKVGVLEDFLKKNRDRVISMLISNYTSYDYEMDWQAEIAQVKEEAKKAVAEAREEARAEARAEAKEQIAEAKEQIAEAKEQAKAQVAEKDRQIAELKAELERLQKLL